MALDSDSSPSSPDMPDSRKRPLDGEQDNTERKRSHFGADGSVYLKILVPCTAAGAIIGKGGETIAQVQKEVNARVKMSKANDFYPGTTERVCLIKGTIESILAMLSFIMDKIKEKPDPNTKAMDFDNKLTVDRDKQVKILVPNSTAGMIIGKGGSFIKQIKEESGAYIQISQKAKDQTLQERCITVIGDGESNKKACYLILTKIGEDPQSGTCLNISYADVIGPVANFNPTGSPYAQGTSAGGSNSGGVPGSQTGAPLQNGSSYSGAHLNNALGTSSNVNSSLGSLGVSLSLGLGYNPPTPVLLGQVLEHVKGVLRTTGFTDLQATEACNALHTLANYGMLGMGGTAATPGPGPMAASIAPTTGLWLNGYGSGYGSSMEANGHSAQTGGAFGPIGSTPQRYADTAAVASAATSSYDPFRRGASPTLPVNQNSFGLGTQPPPPPPPPISSVTTAQTSADGSKVDLHIGENIVGAILGHGGKALLEIQHFSGANIQISKKGVYAPGTRNRIVSITGTPNAISTAQYLIEQRISEEEAKRARQGALSGVGVGGPVAKLDTGVVPSLH